MILKGQLANPGVGIAKVYKLTNNEFSVLKKTITHPLLEIDKYHKAILRTEKNIEGLIQLAGEAADIFIAHKAIASDRDFKEKVEKLIIDHHWNLEYAIQLVSSEYVSFFNQMDDPYMRARSKDILDVSMQIIQSSLNIEGSKIPIFNEPTIVIAEDLLPSQTVTLDNTFIKGLITEQGSQTSHTAIIAKLYNIPALVGVSNLMDSIDQGDLVLLDATNEKVFINPEKDLIKTYDDVFKAMDDEIHFLNQFIDKKSLTKDLKHIPIYANIGSLNDLDEAKKVNIDGIGLVRTEFLYLDQTALPDEDTQYETYLQIVNAFKGLPITFRTLDIGGDKLFALDIENKELNPFLGERAIRFSLKYPKLFKTQIKALLRAGLNSHLKIMLPMIATLDELLQAKKLIEESKHELNLSQTPYNKTYQLGIMIEIPSAAYISDILAKHVDFFSLGTNDLIQYMFAADRMNASVAYLYQPFNPAMIRLIHFVFEQAKKNQIEISVCGEMSSLREAIPYFTLLDVDYLSMITSQVLRAKSYIGKISYHQSKPLIKDILEATTETEIQSILSNILKD